MIFTELQNLINLDVLKADHLKTLFKVKDRQKISIMDQHSCVCDEFRNVNTNFERLLRSDCIDFSTVTAHTFKFVLKLLTFQII